MINTGNYAGENEYINSCIKFNCNICIYKKDKHNNDYNIYNYKFESIYSNYEKYNPFWLIILLGWINNNHFELLLPYNLSKEEYPIEFKILDNKIKISDKNKNKNNIYDNNKYGSEQENKNVKQKKHNKKKEKNLYTIKMNTLINVIIIKMQKIKKITIQIKKINC